MKTLFFLFLTVSLFLSSCSFFEQGKEEEEVEFDTEEIEEELDYIAIPFRRDSNGLMTIRASINGMGIDMEIDTGASNNTISLLEANYLAGKGLLSKEDLVGLSASSLADGSIVPGLDIIIRELTLGDHIVLYNVPFTVLADDNASLLLGQNVLSKFRYEVDPSVNEIKFYDY